MITHARILADRPQSGVSLARLVFDYFEPTVIAAPKHTKNVHPLGHPPKDERFSCNRNGTSAAIIKAAADRIAIYGPVMRKKGWMNIAKIHSATGICPDSIRQRLRKLERSGHVSARKELDGSVFFRWIGK